MTHPGTSREPLVARRFSSREIHAMILRANPDLQHPKPEPELTPAWSDSAWINPAYSWSRELTKEEKSAGWVRAYDRSGSFLSAWSSLVLPIGSWGYSGGIVEFPRAEGGKTRPVSPGYYRTVIGSGWPVFQLPEPFARRGVDGSTVWLTAPLLQLLTEWWPATVLESWTNDRGARPLDDVAADLSAARLQLQGDEQAALKKGYAGATAWFEHLKRRTKLTPRPYWRRAIIDRYVANTWRSLAQASPKPFAFTGVDAALFALSHPEAEPEGLRLGRELGAWKPKGKPLSMTESAGKSPTELIRMAEA